MIGNKKPDELDGLISNFYGWATDNIEIGERHMSATEFKKGLQDFFVQKRNNIINAGDVMEYASYSFKLNGEDRYGDSSEIVVKATSFKEAESLAKELLEGSKIKLGKLCKVVDCRLLIQKTDILEHRMVVEERQLDVNHSGQLTEVRVDGGHLSDLSNKKLKTRG